MNDVPITRRRCWHQSPLGHRTLLCAPRHVELESARLLGCDGVLVHGFLRRPEFCSQTARILQFHVARFVWHINWACESLVVALLSAPFDYAVGAADLDWHLFTLGCRPQICQATLLQ